MDLSQLFKEALTLRSDDFLKTVDRAIALLKSEKGRVGNLTVLNRLVKVEPVGEALVVGDLHGDLESLEAILRQSRFIRKMEKTKNATLIFLGDYGDRGDKSAEVYDVVLKLKLAFPTQIVLLRGNHEGPKDLAASPHDLPLKFQRRFDENWTIVYEKISELWPNLYNAVYVCERYLMVHGGLSPKISCLQDIADAQENHNEALLEDLLWSDPNENVKNVSSSPRGAGKLFGEKVTKEVLEKLNVKVLVRGHEISDTGFKINHGDKVLTLFSRKGSPYFNKYGAYLQMPLSEKFENAQHLIRCIHQF